MSMFIFTITFLSEKDKVFKDVKSTLRHTSLTFTWVKLCKRPEANSKSTRFLTFMTTGRSFPSLDVMAFSVLTCCLYQGTGRQKVLDFLRTSETHFTRK